MNRPRNVSFSLSFEEWNFEEVPDDQKLDCLYYELGRESAIYRKRKSKLTCIQLPDMTLWVPPKADLPIVPIADRSIFTSRLTFKDFCDRYHPFLEFFPEQPWLSLPADLRSNYSSSEGILTGAEQPFFQKAFTPENEINPATSILYGAESKKGLIALHCNINWSFSDETIINDFASWVKSEGSPIRSRLGVKEKYSYAGISVATSRLPLSFAKN
jgi:hypothetical protein